MDREDEVKVDVTKDINHGVEFQWDPQQNKASNCPHNEAPRFAPHPRNGMNVAPYGSAMPHVKSFPTNETARPHTPQNSLCS